MKLVSIVLGQAVRLLRTSNPIGGIYFPDVVTGFKKRYGFQEVPSNIEEFDTAKGITFRHGKFKIGERTLSDGRIYEEIVIDSFQIFSDGLVVGTKAFAEDADLFLDDVIAWASKAFGFTIIEDSPIQYAYNSQIEVEFPQSVASLFEKVSILNKRVTSALENYGNISPDYQISGFILHCDTTKIHPPIPGAFTFERRAQRQYSSNLYFSTAPLKTMDHLAVLEELEAMVKKQ